MSTVTAEGYWEGELTHTKKDGSQITVISRHAVQRDETGRPVAIIEINLDITERKHLESHSARLIRWRPWHPHRRHRPRLQQYPRGHHRIHGDS